MGVELSAVSDDERRLWMTLQRLKLDLELPFRPQVVGIQERDELASGCGDTRVARRAGASVGLDDALHAVDLAGDLRSRILRAVVDHEGLQLESPRLRQHAVQAFTEVRLGVVRGDHDADQRAIGRVALLEDLGL